MVIGRRAAVLACAVGVVTAAAARAEDAPAEDRRHHVSFGQLSGSDPIALTPEGQKVALTPSFSMETGKFVPDPYASRCRLQAVKYTQKKDDLKDLLGDRFRQSDPDDPWVAHPIELRNAAGKYHADAVYLLLNESERLESFAPLRDCTIVDQDGGRYRGESLNEVSCRNPSGGTVSFSQYAGRASFYACAPDRKK